jgi:hypothetical protein
MNQPECEESEAESDDESEGGYIHNAREQGERWNEHERRGHEVEVVEESDEESEESDQEPEIELRRDESPTHGHLVGSGAADK